MDEDKGERIKEPTKCFSVAGTSEVVSKPAPRYPLRVTNGLGNDGTEKLTRLHDHIADVSANSMNQGPEGKQPLEVPLHSFVIYTSIPCSAMCMYFSI
jgi:hypothetical protein